MSDQTNADASPDAERDLRQPLPFYPRAGADVTAQPLPFYPRAGGDARDLRQPLPFYPSPLGNIARRANAPAEQTPFRPQPPIPAQPRQFPPRPPVMSPLPRSFPQPQPKFTPFLGSLPHGDHRNWTNVEPFPQLPQSFELPGIFMQLGRYFSQNGGLMTRGLGAQQMAFASAFINAYTSGQGDKAKLAREQLDLTREKLALQQEAELTQYSDKLTEYETVFGMDPAKLATGVINGQTLEQAYSQIARDIGDLNMEGILQTRGIGAAIEYANKHAAALRDLKKSNQKATEDAAGDALWGQGGGTAADGGATAANPFAAAAPVTGGPVNAKPPIFDSATAEAPAGESPDITGFAPSDPRHGLVMDGVQGTLDTEVMKNAPKTTIAVGKGIQAVNKAIDDITKNPNATPEQVDKQLREISPQLADDAQLVARYKNPVGGGAGTGGGSPKERSYNQRLGRLAERLNPGWSAANYEVVKRFRDEAIDPKMPVQRIITAANNGMGVLDTLDRIMARSGLTANSSPESIKAALGKDPEYEELKQNWLRFQDDMTVLNQGSPSVTITEQGVRSIPQFPGIGSIAAFRAGVKADMYEALGRVRALHQTWEQFHIPEQMPGYNKEAEDQILAASHVDPMTGAMPGKSFQTPLGF